MTVFAACTKETDAPSNGGVNPKNGFIMKVKTAGAGTKTVITDTDGGNSYGINWSAGDKLGVFEVANGEVQAKAESEGLASGGETATFTFSLPGSPSGPYKYAFVYPSSALENTAPDEYSIWIKQEQTFPLNSFDPAADAMISELVSADTRPTSVSAKFARIGATARMVIQAPTLSETIQSITFSTTEGEISGYYTMDPATGEVSEDFAVGDNSVILTPSSSTIPYSGEIVVWFRLGSITLTNDFTVKVRTNAHTYTKEVNLATSSKSLAFVDGKMTKFSVDMDDPSVTVKEILPDGNYLILAKNGDSYYAMKAESTANNQMVSVDYDGSLTSYSGDADMVWTVTTCGDYYTIENDSKYLGYTGGKNSAYWLAADAADWGTTPEDYLLSIDKDGDIWNILTNDYSRWLSKNTSSAIFAFYGNTDQYEGIVFVPATVDARTAVALHFEDGDQNVTDVVNLTTADYNTFFGLNLVADTNETAVTNNIVWSYEDNDGVIDDFDDGALTLTGTAGTATVTATFNGDENFRAATASYTIIVSASNGPQYEKVTSLNDVTAGEYIIVNAGFYLPNVSATSNGPSKVAITISGNKVQSVNDEMKWAFSGTRNAMTIQSSNNNDLYLNVSGSGNNNIRVNNTTNQTWTIGEYMGTLGAFTLKNNTQNRFCATYDAGSDWRSYTSYNADNYGDGGRVYLYKLADDRDDAGMSWSTESATATYTTGNDLTFTAPTLTAGYATGITYESTDETIATIDANGDVTITALSDNDVKEGSSTIMAIFAGNDSYKPQTVSYTLTVADNRDAVETPTFDPAAGEVAENTTVSFLCSDSPVTYYYTTNNTTPTTSSTSGSSVLIDAAQTIKVIATKPGYKPSAVAEAAYSIQGSVPPGPKTYTLTLTADDIDAAGSGTSGYAKYNGNHSKNAVASDNSEYEVSFTTSQVMPNSNQIQFQANAGTLYNTTDLGTITNVSSGNNDLTVIVGNVMNPSSSGSGGYFVIKKTSKGAASTSTITITFEK